MGFFSKIKKILKWIPLLWNQDDTKYTYSISLFKEQLINMANRFEIEGYMYGYYRIETIIKLMDNVYNYKYANEYYESLARPYGDFTTTFVHNNETNQLELATMWEREYTDSEIKQLEVIHKGAFDISAEKQRRAHKLLWKLIEHNIQKWVI